MRFWPTRCNLNGNHIVAAIYSFARYKRALKQPFIYGKKALHSREGLIICRNADDGSKTFAEAAPLPGHSRETLDEITEEINNLIR